MPHEPRDRPLQDAAEQVRETAAIAAAMLSELRKGWLWQLLARPTPKKP